VPKKKYATRQREQLDRKFDDITRSCIECGESFTVEAGEQRFYFSKNLVPRKRCQKCIDRRKSTLNSIDRRDVGHAKG
jgi:putative zinc ribbon protein